MSALPPPARPPVRPMTYSVAEVATLLALSPGVVRKAIINEQIPAIQIGRFWRIPIRRFHEEVLGEPWPAVDA